ncbi:MAG: SDR family NAD(P)-dependent oxidoreductase [Burkholderiaceae bacterium]|nr:SDR family NAD(P)-dependent oxidoreductase [Burkholderiaceae bacterium]
MNRLEHKVALVTGAARGIGAAIAQAFVAEGAFVIVSDIDEPGGRATADSLGAAWLKLDVREELAWIGAMARALDSHGRLDVLVNNAGISGLARHDPEHTALADWHAVMRTNLDGVFLGCKHALRAMRRGTPAGSIINIASRSGRVGVPAAAAYAASGADADVGTPARPGRAARSQHGRPRGRHTPTPLCPARRGGRAGRAAG